MKPSNLLRSVSLLLLSSTLAFAQDISSKIIGTVTDPSGAVVAGANVTVHEIARGIDYPATTNAAGVYYVSPLPIGSYVVSISAPGFSTTKHDAFALAMDQTARIDVILTLGQTATVVDVSSASPLLQTDQTFIGTVLDAAANVALPLATRN